MKLQVSTQLKLQFFIIKQSEKWIEKTSPNNPSFVIMYLRTSKGKTDHSVEWAGI